VRCSFLGTEGRHHLSNFRAPLKVGKFCSGPSAPYLCLVTVNRYGFVLQTIEGPMVSTGQASQMEIRVLIDALNIPELRFNLPIFVRSTQSFAGVIGSAAMSGSNRLCGHERPLQGKGNSVKFGTELSFPGLSSHDSTSAKRNRTKVFHDGFRHLCVWRHSAMVLGQYIIHRSSRSNRSAQSCNAVFRLLST
jgi:hypothetical protein